MIFAIPVTRPRAAILDEDRRPTARDRHDGFD